MPKDNYDHDAFLARTQEGMTYIDQFENVASGIIGLSGGFSLESAAKAGLLKESFTPTVIPDDDFMAQVKTNASFISQFDDKRAGATALRLGLTFDEARAIGIY